MLWLWIVLGVVYYFLGWLLFAGLHNDLEKCSWYSDGFGIGITTFFGLWIFWVVFVMLERWVMDNENEINIENNKIDDKSGVLFKKQNNEKMYVYYNMPSENYHAFIPKDIKESSRQQVDRIIKRLEKWGKSEITKWDKIKSYEEHKNNIGDKSNTNKDINNSRKIYKIKDDIQ